MSFQTEVCGGFLTYPKKHECWGGPGCSLSAQAYKTGAQEGSWEWGESATAVLVLAADRKLGLPARTSIPP